MKHRLISFLILTFSWLFDFLTKLWAKSLTGIVEFGPLTFELYYNPGLFLGTFTDQSPYLRIISVSIIGALLLCLYILVEFLLPIQSIRLKMGLSFLTGGILGNFSDRIISRRVIDFIYFGYGPIFNVGDIFQGVGYFIIFYAIFKDWNFIWHENNLRKNFWVNPNFQLRYCFLFSGIGLAVSFIFFVLNYSLFYVFRESIPSLSHLFSDEYLSALFISFAITTTLITLLLFLIGKFISHRLIGPVYAFEKYVNRLLNGEMSSFRTRSNDEFKQLEKIAESINKFIEKNKSE